MKMFAAHANIIIGLGLFPSCAALFQQNERKRQIGNSQRQLSVADTPMAIILRREFRFFYVPRL
jgi:hypothetical protein